MDSVSDGDVDPGWWSETSAETGSEVDERAVYSRDAVSAALFFGQLELPGRTSRSRSALVENVPPPLSVGSSAASKNSTIGPAPAKSSGAVSSPLKSSSVGADFCRDSCYSATRASVAKWTEWGLDQRAEKVSLGLSSSGELLTFAAAENNRAAGTGERQDSRLEPEGLLMGLEADPLLDQDECHQDALRLCEATRKARHLSVAQIEAIQEQTSSVVFVDLRRQEEQDVSHLPTAYLVSYEGTLAAAEAAMEAWDIPAAVADADFVIAYCTAGWRGSVASTVLEKRLNRPCYNLGGGAAAWFNLGLPVIRDGIEVDALHPCAQKWVQWIGQARRNTFILPG